MRSDIDKLDERMIRRAPTLKDAYKHARTLFHLDNRKMRRICEALAERELAENHGATVEGLVRRMREFACAPEPDSHVDDVARVRSAMTDAVLAKLDGITSSDTPAEEAAVSFMRGRVHGDAIGDPAGFAERLLTEEDRKRVKKLCGFVPIPSREHVAGAVAELFATGLHLDEAARRRASKQLALRLIAAHERRSAQSPPPARA
jgi:hypothetical protein